LKRADVLGLVEDRGGRRDGQAPAVRHGIVRVDGQVQQHLPELRVVGLDRRQIGREVENEVHLLGHGPPQQFLDAAHDAIHVEAPHGQHLLPAEREQLSRERGRPFGGLLNLLDLLLKRTLRRQRFAQCPGATENDRQQVVEIVRDPRRRASRWTPSSRPAAVAPRPAGAARPPGRPR
jgi:hypothetical protein